MRAARREALQTSERAPVGLWAMRRAMGSRTDSERGVAEIAPGSLRRTLPGRVAAAIDGGIRPSGALAIAFLVSLGLGPGVRRFTGGGFRPGLAGDARQERSGATFRRERGFRGRRIRGDRRGEWVYPGTLYPATGDRRIGADCAPGAEWSGAGPHGNRPSRRVRRRLDRRLRSGCCARRG